MAQASGEIKYRVGF